MPRLLFSRRPPRSLPIFRLLAVAHIALLARRHLGALDTTDRRLATLVRKGRGLIPEDCAELRALAAKLEPRAFALAAADKLSPVRLPARLLRRS